MDLAPLKASLSDREAVALTLWGEARGEPVEGRIAIASVIRTRTLTPGRWGATYRATCLQRAQFSCWWPSGGSANYERVLEVAHALKDGRPIDAVLRESLWIADGTIAGDLRDRVNGANHYHTIGVAPAWSRSRTPVARIGPHLFFRL